MFENEKKPGTIADGATASTMPADTAKHSETDISEAELQMLFDRYLGDADKKTEGATPDLAPLPAFMSEISETDVNKNIDEAEKYIDEALQKEQAEDKKEEITFSDDPFADETGGFALDIQDTEQLSAFEPSLETDTEIDLATTRVIEAQDTVEAPAPDFPTDTAMMKAFGLDPKTAELMRGEKLFEETVERPVPETEPETEELAAWASREEEAPAPEEEAPKETGFEYTEASQNKTIFDTFKSKYNFAKIRMALAAAVALFLGLLENLPMVTDLFGGTSNVIAIDWVLAFAAGALVFDRILMAAKALARYEVGPDTVTLAGFVLSFATTLVTLVLAPSSYEAVYLYNFPFAVCVFLNTLYVFIRLRRDIYSFKTISVSGTKKVIDLASFEMDRIPERVDFAEHLEEDENVCTLKKTDFISSFFAHRKEGVRTRVLLQIALPAGLLIAIAFFFVSMFAMDNTAAQSLGTAYAAFMMTVPFAAFITYSYPLYLASRRAYTYHSAILGETPDEKYKKTAVLALRDDEVFPADRTKVKGLKLYGDRKIENVMYYASSVYTKIGGPLATVFKQATLNSVTSKDVEIREMSRDGVSAMVDGKNVVIGRPSYMEAQCFELIPDIGDDQYGGKSNKRILYLACDQIIIAKLYVQYSAHPDFFYMVRRMAAAGVCASVRTADPCIDDGVLYESRLDPEQYPVKIVKGILPEEKASELSAKRGGVVSVGTPKEIVKTFLVCDKIGNVKKTNAVLQIVAAVLGLAVMVLVLATGHATTMLSVFPALYQLFWLLPIYVISKIYI